MLSFLNRAPQRKGRALGTPRGRGGGSGQARGPPYQSLSTVRSGPALGRGCAHSVGGRRRVDLVRGGSPVPCDVPLGTEAGKGSMQGGLHGLNRALGGTKTRGGSPPTRCDSRSPGPGRREEAGRAAALAAKLQDSEKKAERGEGGGSRVEEEAPGEARKAGLGGRLEGRTRTRERRRRRGVRTGRGLGRRRLCRVRDPGGGAYGSWEESPKEERDPEQLDHHAARGEGPRAQPHGARPGAGPRLRGAASERARTGRPTGAASPSRTSAGAPEIRKRRGSGLRARVSGASPPRPLRGPAHSLRGPARLARKLGLFSLAFPGCPMQRPSLG